MTRGQVEGRRNGAAPPAPAVPGFVYHACRLMLGALFVLASYEKIERPWDFGRAIYVYEMLVGPFAYLISPTAVILPLLELVAGACLIVNRWVRPAALIILALNAVFMVAIGSAIARGMDIDCGCGLDVGVVAQLVGTQADWEAIARDIVVVAVNLVVLLAPQSRRAGSG